MADYERIRGALLGDQWLRLYHLDADFHHFIDMLTRMLPMWVAGMAEAARQSEADRNIRLRELQAAPAPSDWH